MRSYRLNEKHLANVLRLPAPERYNYFIKRVADWRVVWSIRAGDGWKTASDDEGNELFPVWPHARFAELCATGAWAGSVPQEISLKEWLEGWTPQLKEDKRMVAVFPLPGGSGIPVDPVRIEEDIRQELSRF